MVVLKERGVEQNSTYSPPCRASINTALTWTYIAHTHSIEECKNSIEECKGLRKGLNGGSSPNRGHTPGLGLQLPFQPSASSSASSSGKAPTNVADVTCYFCHQKGHNKKQASVPEMVGSPLIFILSAHPAIDSAIGSHSWSPRMRMRYLYQILAVYGARTLLVMAAIAPLPSIRTISTRQPLCSCSSCNLWWLTPNLIALSIVIRLYPMIWCSPGLRPMTGGITDEGTQDEYHWQDYHQQS